MKSGAKVLDFPTLRSDPFRSTHRSGTVTLVVHGVPVDDRRNRKGTSTEGRGTSKEGRSHSPGGGVRPIVRTTNTVSTAVTRWPVRHGSARDVPSETPRGWRACPLVTRGLRLSRVNPDSTKAIGLGSVALRPPGKRGPTTTRRRQRHAGSSPGSRGPADIVRNVGIAGTSRCTTPASSVDNGRNPG